MGKASIFRLSLSSVGAMICAMCHNRVRSEEREMAGAIRCIHLMHQGLMQMMQPYIIVRKEDPVGLVH